MSWHNHLTGFSDAVLASLDKVGLEDPTIAKAFSRVPADPAEYFRDWISTPAVVGQSDGTPELSYFDLETGYWAERRRPNFLMVHFSDLLADLDAEMRRIAAFLGIEVNETVWPSLVRASDFKEMQAHGEAITPGQIGCSARGVCGAFSTREQTDVGVASLPMTISHCTTQKSAKNSHLALQLGSKEVDSQLENRARRPIEFSTRKRPVSTQPCRSTPFGFR